jgi:hypothetical protein
MRGAQGLTRLLKWSPVRELHPAERFCRPLPWLLGQRDASNDFLTFTAKRSNGSLFGEFSGNAHGDILEGTGKQGQRKVTWLAKRTITPPPGAAGSRL